MSWIIFVLIGIVAAGALFYFLKKGEESTPLQRAANDESAPSTAFHAVSIKTGKTACTAAKELSGQRFLSGEAPSLPLPDCETAECHCRFIHHKDRRASNDRRSPFGPGGVGGSGSYAKEQREGRERRKTRDEDLFG